MVRALGTKARIQDMLEGLGEDKKIKDVLLEDAKTLIGQEIGKDLSRNYDYLEWFAKTLGQNLAKLHKNGWLHGQIGKHNITLDCRLVDLGAVNENKKNAESIFLREREIERAEECLDDLVRSLGLENEIYKFSEKFLSSYKNAFPEIKSVRFSK